MKIVIELTKEQISQLIKAETATLLINKEKTIEQAEKLFSDEVAKLEKKYKNYTIDTSVNEISVKKEKTTRTKLDTELVKTMFNDGSSVKLISSSTGKSDLAIRAALKKLGLKLADRK